MSIQGVCRPIGFLGWLSFDSSSGPPFSSSCGFIFDGVFVFVLWVDPGVDAGIDVRADAGVELIIGFRFAFSFAVGVEGAGDTETEVELKLELELGLGLDLVFVSGSELELWL